MKYMHVYNNPEKLIYFSFQAQPIRIFHSRHICPQWRRKRQIMLCLFSTYSELEFFLVNYFLLN